MKSRSVMLAGASAMLLAACETMPSEYAYLNTTPETVEQWLAECEGNENDPLRKARFCELAEKSIDESSPDYAFTQVSLGNTYFRQNKWPEAERAYLNAIQAGRSGDVYGSLAYVREHLGKFDMARQDLQMAHQQTGDGKYLDEIGYLDYALKAAQDYELEFMGIACRAVQKDSVFHPDNEISLHLVVADSEYAMAAELPGRGRGYENVRAGTVVPLRKGIFNVTGMRPFTLSAMMWEVDDGGPAVDVSVMYAGMLAGKAAGSVAKRAVAPSELYVPPPQVEHSPKPSSVHDAVSSAIKGAFGTANDYMGGTDFTDMIAADIFEDGPKVENGISYHFKSVHRRDGADCSAYFALRPFGVPQAEHIARVNFILDEAF